MALDAGPGMSGHEPKHADGQAWQVGLRKYKLLSEEKMGTCAQELKVRWGGSYFLCLSGESPSHFLEGVMPTCSLIPHFGVEGIDQCKELTNFSSPRRQVF